MMKQTKITSLVDQTKVTPIKVLNEGPRWAGRGSLLLEYATSEVAQVSAWLVLHALIGLVFAKSALAAAVHAALTLGVGLWWALSTARLERAAYLCAYITSAEAFWRMNSAPIPWEIGKYAIISICLLALLRKGKFGGAGLPFLFFVLLLPSVILPTVNLTNEDLRENISFHLSGPLALAVCVWFFSHVKLTPPQLHRVFLALIGPVISIGAVTVHVILTTENLVLQDESNALLSGGWGPNQVSAMLGMGALISFLWAADGSAQRLVKTLMMVVTIYLISQSILTFSRGGAYMAAGGALAGSLFLVSDVRTRIQLLVGAVVVAATINFVVFPALDNFTGGGLSKRFGDTRPSGRDNIVRGDLAVFSEHMLFGVGPGQSKYFRDQRDHYARATSHTEFTRLAAEHGLFGVAAMLVLILMAFRHFLRTPSLPGKGLVAATVIWSFLFMTSTAMRLAAPAYLFGLSAALLVPRVSGRAEEKKAA